MSLIHHPDKGGSNTIMKNLNKYYGILVAHFI